jgi:hypothetical protein
LLNYTSVVGTIEEVPSAPERGPVWLVNGELCKEEREAKDVLGVPVLVEETTMNI